MNRLPLLAGLIVLALGIAATPLAADDLTGAERFLCSAGLGEGVGAGSRPSPPAPGSADPTPRGLGTARERAPGLR